MHYTQTARGLDEHPGYIARADPRIAIAPKKSVVTVAGNVETQDRIPVRIDRPARVDQPAPPAVRIAADIGIAREGMEDQHHRSTAVERAAENLVRQVQRGNLFPRLARKVRYLDPFQHLFRKY